MNKDRKQRIYDEGRRDGFYAGVRAERTLSASQIVRCRDCRRFELDNSDHDYRSGWWCHRWNTDMVKPDGFCAWGERMNA